MNFFKKHKKERPLVAPFIKLFAKGKGKNSYHRNVNYRLCSEVYQATDAGFSQEEIKESYRLEQKVYHYIMRIKPVIAPRIIKGLEKMFPGQQIYNPYREFTVE